MLTKVHIVKALFAAPAFRYFNHPAVITAHQESVPLLLPPVNQQGSYDICNALYIRREGSMYNILERLPALAMRDKCHQTGTQ